MSEQDEDDFTPDADVPMTVEQMAEDFGMMASARATIDALKSENAALRKQIEGHCERIAAASEVIARNAERNALARLEAWQREEPDYCAYEVRQYRVKLVADLRVGVEAYRCPSEASDYGGRRTDPAHVVVAGTDDKPATLAECILAALARWEQLYGAAVELKGGA